MKKEQNKGLILVNLGSPDSFQVKDVRKYLRQFLMDENVIDVPYAVRKLIVEGFILPFRPAKSAEAYSTVWTPDGPPLKVITEQFKKSIEDKINMPVKVAMRYGSPSPADAVKELLAVNPKLDDILIAPLYPHYAMSSFGTALDFTLESVKKMAPSANIHVLKPFFNEENYIQSLAASIAPYLEQSYDHLLFSYHGLPERHLKKSDPTGVHCMQSSACCETPSQAWDTCYRHQVKTTTNLVAKALGLPPDKFSVSFQSRLGRDPWLQPFTDFKFKEMPSQGIKKLLVVCPAFVADCLETLEEISIRGKESFLESGGTSFTSIPCLNTSSSWITTFSDYINQYNDRYAHYWKTLSTPQHAKSVY